MTKENIIKTLNEYLVIDREVIESIFLPYHLCNESMANHPSVQTAILPGNKSGLRVIGVLNGLIGTNQARNGYIGMKMIDNHIKEFILIIE